MRSNMKSPSRDEASGTSLTRCFWLIDLTVGKHCISPFPPHPFLSINPCTTKCATKKLIPFEALSKILALQTSTPLLTLLAIIKCFLHLAHSEHTTGNTHRLGRRPSCIPYVTPCLVVYCTVYFPFYRWESEAEAVIKCARVDWVFSLRCLRPHFSEDSEFFSILFVQITAQASIRCSSYFVAPLQIPHIRDLEKEEHVISNHQWKVWFK